MVENAIETVQESDEEEKKRIILKIFCCLSVRHMKIEKAFAIK